MRVGHVSGSGVVIFIASSVCLVAASALPALAQGGRRAAAERRVEQLNRQREQYERDSMGRDLGPEAGKPGDKREAQAVASQIRQDFERIQQAYNELVLAMSAGGALDYKFVSEATTKVRQSAGRLKSNLALPQPEDEKSPKKPQADLAAEQIKPSLLALRQHIRSFVMNPLFESSGVLDVELSTKASRDLIKIIELSDQIKKSADKLLKPGN